MRGFAAAGGDVSRRAVIGGGAAAALSAAAYGRVLGANERVGLGFIGFGLIGKRHVLDFKDQPDADARGASPRSTAAGATKGAAPAGGAGPGVCRLPRLARRPRRRCGGRLDARPLARPDDHDGLRRGQGRLRREAAVPVRPRRALDGRRGPAAQPRRPGRDAAAVGPALPEGARADPAAARSARSSRCGCGPTATSCPASARPPDGRPPAGARLRHVARPGTQTRRTTRTASLYHFRWFWDYSGGQMTNLGQHSLDIVHWFLDADGPAAVTSAGGRFASRTTARRPTRRTPCSNTRAGSPPGRTASAAGVPTRQRARVLRHARAA